MISENALIVLQRRYLAKDETGKVTETPDELFRRVACHIASAEANYAPEERDRVEQEFYTMLSRLEFLPNSPTLMNAGRELGQLAACFVLPVRDSLDSIFEQVKNTARIHQSGGGTGFSFSMLRPKGDVVASTMGVASGPVSFIRIFNMATEVIKQGGTRRGANMGILRVDHPDIEEFVTIKGTKGELENFNLSVAITDRFMDAWEKDDEFPLVNPRDNNIVKKVNARSLFRLIAESAWVSGEPGVIFIDTINRYNPTPNAGRIEATNPCGEMPLLPYESCCLGSINLSELSREGSIDWKRLKRVVHLAVRLLDNVIDANRYPLDEIERTTKANRKIGIGVMGFAHMLIRLGIPYDSPEAVQTAGALMRCIQEESKVASQILATERGAFPNYRGSIWERQHLPQRNATTTTIAPAGTLSIIAGTSSGIEPVYDVVFKRVLFGDIEIEEADPLYRELGRRMDEKALARLFRRAYQVSPMNHLRIQAAFQRYVDNAVSKTINLSESAGVGDIMNIYLHAYRIGLKGVTVFRDKSRGDQVLSCGVHRIC